MVFLTPDTAFETMRALDGKARLQSFEHYEDGWPTPEGAAWDRLTEAVHPSEARAFVAVFEDAQDATLFIMFHEDVATRINDDDHGAADRAREEEAEVQALARLREEAKAKTGQVDLPNDCFHRWVMGHDFLALPDDPTSPRVTIR